MVLVAGDKVQVQNAPYHKGTVIHQTDDRVLWKCDECDTIAEDRRDDLRKIPDEEIQPKCPGWVWDIRGTVMKGDIDLCKEFPDTCAEVRAYIKHIEAENKYLRESSRIMQDKLSKYTAEARP